MSRLWRCDGCERLVNPFVNGDRCPTCGGERTREALTDGGSETCPACGEESSTIYRCEHCGYDLVEVRGSA